MGEVKNVPKLRFPEYSGSWEKLILGKIAEFSKGKGISKSDIDENGTLECIRYGELYTTYKETISDIKSKTNLDPDKLILSKYNDIIIPASGETQIDIATAACVLKDNVALSGDLNIIRTEKNGVFISYYLNEKKKKDIASLAQGNSVVHLYAKQLKTLSLNLPTLPEQEKIANFLTAVDAKISNLSEEKSLLEQYKKGAMQKIFSRELRFKIENERGELVEPPEWENKRLGEVCECLDNKRQPLNNSERENIKGSYPYWGANNIMDFINKYIFDETIVLLAEDGGNFNEYKTRPIANISFGKCWVNNHTHVLKGRKNKLTNEFLYYSLVHKNITGFVSGGTRSKLIKSEMLKIPLIVPTLKEQTKIANFLSAIDEKIATVSEALEGAQAFKKGLLQQLFV